MPSNPTILSLNKKETYSEECGKHSLSSMALVAENKTLSIKVIGKARNYGTCTYVPMDFKKYGGNNANLLSLFAEKKKRKLEEENDENVVQKPEQPKKEKPLTFCSCPINKKTSRYCQFHFNKKSIEVQNSRVECNG